MSGDIFKIGVALALTQNGIAPALSLISHQLIGVHKSVAAINSGFGKWKTALAGAAGVMAGTALLGGLAKIASYGEKFLDQQAKLQLLGLNNKQIAEATAKAWANTRAVPGSTVADNLKTIGELHSITGFDEAVATSAKFTQLDAVLKQVTGKEGSAFTTARAAELLGVFSDKQSGAFDISGFNKFMDQVGRAAIATHGKVGPADFLAFAKQAGPAAANLTDDGLLTEVAIMQAMGGHRAGTAAAALNRQFAGGVMAQRVAKELERIGIAKPGDFETGRGGQIIAKNGAMGDVVSALQHDPLSAIGLILPKLQAAGFDTNEKLSAEIYKMIGTGPAQREIYELIRGRNQIASERDRAKQTLPTGDALGVLNKNSPIAAKGAVESAWSNMMTALGSEALRASIPLMLELTKFFNAIGAFAQSHPTALKLIGEGIAVLGAGLIAAGGLAIVAAFGVGGWLVVGIGALGVAIMNFEAIWKKFVGWISSIGNVFQNSAFGHLVGLGSAAPTVSPPPTETSNGTISGDVYLDSDKMGRWMGKAARRLSEHSIVGPALFDPATAATPNDSAFAIP